MLSFFDRLKTIVAAKGDAALDAAEVPAEMMNHAYNKMNDTMTQLSSAIVEVITARKLIEQQISGISVQDRKIEDQAKQALAIHNESLATQIIARRPALQSQLASLQASLQGALKKEADLEAARDRLRAKIQSFRSQTQTIQATSGAAKAQVNALSMLAGITEEMGSVNAAVDRAQLKITQQDARADALSEVVSHLDFDTGAPIDPVQAQLDHATAQLAISSDLERLKAEMGLSNPIPLTSQPVPVNAGQPPTAVIGHETSKDGNR